MDATDALRTGRLSNTGDMFTNLLNFQEFQRPSASSGMPPQPGGVQKTPASRRSPASVAHRPWEDSIPCEPRWPQDYYYDGLADMFPGKPKTFKPVLLYHRPEEPELPFLPRFRPCYGHLPSFSPCEGDEGDCCSFHCHEDAEENMRDFLHSAMVHDHLYRLGHDVYDPGYSDYLEYNCPCDFHNPLGSRLHSLNAMKHSSLGGCSLQRPERTSGTFRRHRHAIRPFTNDSFSYPLPPFPNLYPHDSLTGSPPLPFPVTHRTQSQSGAHRPPPNYSAIHRTPYPMSEPPVHPALASFPLPVHNRLSAAHAVPKPYIPMFAKQAETTDRGSAVELRRALLNNHPVLDDTRDLAGSDKYGKPVDTVLHDTHTTAFAYKTNSKKRVDHQDCEQTSSPLSSVFSVNSDLSLAAGACSSNSVMTPTVTRSESALSTLSQISPASSLMSEGSDNWQEWAGRYGSFLQFLNSPQSPRPQDTSSGLPSSSMPASKAVTDNRPADYVDFSGPLEQTNPQWGGDTSHRKQSTVDSVGDRDRESKKHKCPYCDVTCTNNGQLKGHLRVHTGERPYICDCGRAFARNEELTRHRRIHSGLRPHVCGICGKRFGRKDHLNKHQKTHLQTSEKKTHVCQVAGCQQRYTRSDALARHQWGAHGIKAKTSRIRPLLQGQGHDPAAMTQPPERSLTQGAGPCDLLPFPILS